MRKLKLRLRNMIGIKKGLGVDEISLDLSQISGLIALAGKNGAGKSSVLESLQPYARLASRDGALQHHFFGKNAEKEFSFEFNGDQYKTLIKIDAEAGKTEGYLWKNGVSEVDGKISNYNKYIKALIGSPELFFNSSFCSQNSKKLNELTTGKLKELFSEFLRLYKLTEYEDTSNQCLCILTTKKHKLRAEIEQLNSRIFEYGDPSVPLDVAKKAEVSLNHDIIRFTNDLEVAEQGMSELQSEIKKDSLLRAENDNARSEIARIIERIEKDRDQESQEVQELRSKYSAVDLELVEIDRLLANEDEIREAGLEYERLQDFIKAEMATLAEMEKVLSTEKTATTVKQAEYVASVRDKKEQVSTINNTQALLEQELKTAQLSSADLDKRDPACVSTVCSFIVRAFASKDEIESIESKLTGCSKAKDNVEATYSKLIQRLKAESRAFMDSDSKKAAEITSLASKIANKKQGLVSVKELSAKLPLVLEASTKKEHIKQQKADIAKEGTRIKNIWINRIDEQKTQLNKAEESLAKTTKSVDDTLSDREAFMVEDIRTIKRSTKNAVDELPLIIAKITSLQKNVSAKIAEKQALSIRESELKAVISEVVDWGYIKNACGKKGLQALEIDAVAPVITSHANDLLLSTFGPAFTIRFRTQDDEGREILDIIAISEDGSEISLDFLSGGEKVWLLKALRLSMTLISKEKSGIEILTGFADEADGALDTGKAIEFMSMYRAFMKAGTLETFLFISHKSELMGMSDHTLTFGNGKIEID